MFLIKRKNGSQRASVPIRLKFFPNFAGQGGSDCLTMQATDGTWYTLEFDSAEEVHEFMSQAHIIHHNFKET